MVGTSLDNICGDTAKRSMSFNGFRRTRIERYGLLATRTRRCAFY